MIISDRMKRKLEAAKAKGYENLYVIAGAYKATKYCVFHGIDELLAKPTGYDTGRAHGGGMWTGHANTRMVDDNDIGYMELFSRF